MKFTRLLQYITPHRNTLLLVLLLLIADSLAALAQPRIAGELTAVILVDNSSYDFIAMQKILLLWLALILAKSIINFFSNYLVGSTGEKMAARLCQRVYEHMQVLPISYFHAGRPISGLANVYGQIQRTRGAAERLVGFFAEQPEPPEIVLPPLQHVKGHISFEKVSFAYLLMRFIQPTARRVSHWQIKL